MKIPWKAGKKEVFINKCFISDLHQIELSENGFFPFNKILKKIPFNGVALEIYYSLDVVI